MTGECRTVIACAVMLVAACQGDPVGSASDNGGEPPSGGGGASAPIEGEGARSGESAGGDAGSSSKGGGAAGGTSAGEGGRSPAGAGAGGLSLAVGGAGGNIAGSGTGGEPVPRCSLCTCRDGLCEPEIVHREGGTTLDRGSVAVGDREVYFLLRSSNRIDIKSVPKHGGTPTTLFSQNNCMGCALGPMTVAGDDVFFIHGSTALDPYLAAVPNSELSTTPRRVASMSGGFYPQLFASHDGYVYFYENTDGIWRAPIDGNDVEPENMVGNGSSSLTGLVAAGDRLVYSFLEGPVYSFSLDTSIQTPIGSPQENAELCGVALDDDVQAYWVECTFPYAVYREGTADPIADTLDSSDDPYSNGGRWGSIAIDGEYLYFLDYRKLNRVRLPDGPVEAIGWTDSDTLATAYRIAGIDDTYVYLHAKTPHLSRVLK